MSTSGVEITQQPTTMMGERSPSTKNLSTQQVPLTSTSTSAQEKAQQHPLHQYDWTVMGKFLDSCVSKLAEQQPNWKPTEWSNAQPMPAHLTTPEQKHEWCNPLIMSQKQSVYECFAQLARETGEPMILMPSFDYGDILNFERFLQALKKDGVNAIGKYKQYLNNKDMRKFEIDLVVMHARYGVMLIEIKECDHLDVKRRSRARAQLNQARSCFETMGRLIIEAKGWTSQEAHVPVTEFIALPNVLMRPVPPHQQQNISQTQQQPLLSSNIVLQPVNDNQDHSGLSSSSSSSHRNSRQIHYIVKSDMENKQEFAKWWTKHVVEPKQQQQKQAETDNKQNKYDVSVLNWMTGLINCIRNNSIMPVVYPESGNMFTTSESTGTTSSSTTMPTNDEQKPQSNATEEQNGEHADKQSSSSSSSMPFTQALNLHGEFFQAEHEKLRSLPKVVVTSKDVEQIRKTVCLQTLWLLLNDSQKKICVVCSDLNKPYYEEFFARQRKLYNNLNNVRFFTDLHSCAVNGQNTLKKDGEIWFFDSAINGTLSNVMERVKNLNAFWIFTTQEESLGQWQNDFESWGVKICKIDHQHQHQHQQQQENNHQHHQHIPQNLKFPLRLQTDLLIIGDIIDSTQMKSLYHVLEKTHVSNQSMQYQNGGHNHYQSNSHNHHHYQQQQQQPKQKLNFNAAKKFKSVKFIRGGTIDNLRNSLKMHDSIQAQVVLLHVGDEDLFKTRQSNTTAERIKELANLVKEYCPNSFIILSTLMRRMSRTENQVSNEVNKGIINFCKQTREQANFHYMLNNHFDPDYHTQGGRVLINHGLRQYIENIMFVVDYFMIRHNKQH